MPICFKFLASCKLKKLVMTDDAPMAAFKNSRGYSDADATSNRWCSGNLMKVHQVKTLFMFMRVGLVRSCLNSNNQLPLTSCKLPTCKLRASGYSISYYITMPICSYLAGDVQTLTSVKSRALSHVTR